MLVNGFSVTSFRTFLKTPYLVNMVDGNGGRGGIKIASANTQSANEPRTDLILVHTVQLKLTIKEQISGRMASIGISDVVTASVYLEKTRLKKFMKIIIIIIMNKSQETTVFHGRQKLTSAMKQMVEN